MFANQRRNEICEMLKDSSAVTTSVLAKKFNVSIETIRKDFLILEREGELIRVHGGATSKPAAKGYVNYSDRMDSMRTEKSELATIAARYINEGDVIAVDCGSTSVEFIEVLMQNFENLTIVTHSMDIFQRACRYKNFNIILCGGFFLKEENAFYGDFAARTFEDIHVSKSFVFPAAISLKSGLTDSLPQLADMQKKLIKSCDNLFILADSSKFEKSAFIKVLDLNQKYTYISDSKLSADIKEIYAQNGIEVITE